MEMELEFFHENFTELDLKLITDQIRSAASGDALSLPVTLSLVHDKLVEKSFPGDAPRNSGTSQVPANQSAATSGSFQTSGFTGFTTPFQATSSASATTTTPTQTSSASGFGSNPTPITGFSRFPGAITPPTTFSFSSPRVPVPAPTPGPSRTQTRGILLRCARCSTLARQSELYNNLHCPLCSENGKDGRGGIGRPFMTCSECGKMRVANVGKCRKKRCKAQFVA